MFKLLKTGLLACALSVFTLHPVWADDTEIFFNSIDSGAKINLLFVIDASGSMAWFDCKDGSIRKDRIPCGDGTPNGDYSRYDRMSAAMDQVMAGLSDDLNVGVMRFGGFDGGRIIYPIRDLAEPGVREDINDVIDDIKLISGTPTVGTLEEAWRYYAGKPVVHGKVRALTNSIYSKRNSRVSNPDTYTGGSVEGRGSACTDDDLNNIACEDEHITGDAVYKSPIVGACQANHVILMTDGEPFVGPRSFRLPASAITVNTIKELTGGGCKGVGFHGNCGEEMTKYMFDTDSSPLPGKQNIVTHAIGFNVAIDWIEDVAKAGSGIYREAESSDDLVNTISEIVDTVTKTGTTFVAPSVTLDQATRLSHRKETYLGLFRPQNSAAWEGNLKKYKLAGVNGTLKDADGNAAIDAATGEFLPGSKSFWSGSSDGADIVLGGAAEKLNPNTRRIVSNLNVGTDNSLLLTDVPENNPNEIHEDNNLVTAAMLGHAEITTGAAGANQVCFFDNADWSWTSNQGVNFRLCSGVRGITPFGDLNKYNNAISAVSVGENFHTILYDGRGGTGSSMCVSSGTDINTLGGMANRASSFEVGHGACLGQETTGLNVNRELLISWLKGTDVKDEDEDEDTTDSRNHIGDPLHSNPVVVTYGVETIDNDAPDSLVFFGTNEGFLHAIDTESGVEEYAFMPRELLPNVSRLFANATVGQNSLRPYGLDGNITLRTIDKNNNGAIEASQGDKAYLYVGMRRGGRNYYALDVSVKDDPKFLWSINGGSGDFAELGQSWSKPISTKVKINSDIKNVLLFAGGYDPEQDNHAVRTADAMGRAIFMVDADTGDLLWSGGNSDNHPGTSFKHFEFNQMDYSIPSKIAIVPDTNTGFLSQMYVGDMGGQLWRFDIDNGSGVADLVDGGVIADFGEDGITAGARRFYSAPDLSISKVNGFRVLNIAIGSGYRAHPLNRNIDDKFFVFRYPFAGYEDEYGKDGTAATLLDMFDTTDNKIAQGTETEREDAYNLLAQKEGWFITMERSGEKIINVSTTFENVVRFVSYVPALPGEDPCLPVEGRSFAYAVNLLDGTPFEGSHEIDNSDPSVVHVLDREYRSKELPSPGIAPPIRLVFVEHEGVVTPTDVSGVNTVHEWEEVDLLNRWYWSETPE